MKTKCLAFSICCILNFSVFAQSLAKWGELQNYEKNMTVCSFDSTAEAVVLSDYERIDLQYTEPLTIQHHQRIKILKLNAKDRGDIAIPFYHKDGVDKIKTINAQTLNIESGQVVKIPVQKKNFFIVEIDEYWSELRFSFPDVKAGSILEYDYTIETLRYDYLRSWIFQNDIPTLYSQVTAYIDTRFQYRISYQGFRLQEKYKEGEHKTWLLTNLPKIEWESHCANFFDYTEQINFQLESYFNSFGTRVIVVKTWEEFAKDFLQESGFSKILNKKSTADNIIASVIDENDPPKEKIKKLHNFVTSNYQWNGYYGIRPDISLKKLLEEKKGGGDDINTFLILLLRSAGFEADPVLISTKDHGFVSKSAPFVSQFNQLICNVRLEGKDILLDASQGQMPVGLLDKNNLNREGFLLHEDQPRWVEIPVNKDTRTIKMVTMEFENPEEIKYKFEVSSTAYDAFDMRKAIKKSALKEYLVSQQIRKNAEISVDSISGKDLENLEKPTFITAIIRDRNLSVINDDFVYLNPFVDAVEEANPFSDPERFLPVDLVHPFETGYILNLTIPEDYEVVEYPEPMNLKLAGDKGFLKFSSSLSGNKLQMRINLIFKDYFFHPSEYTFLKELYAVFLEKRQEQIVLKKKT